MSSKSLFVVAHTPPTSSMSAGCLVGSDWQRPRTEEGGRGIGCRGVAASIVVFEEQRALLNKKDVRQRAATAEASKAMRVRTQPGDFGRKRVTRPVTRLESGCRRRVGVESGSTALTVQATRHYTQQPEVNIAGVGLVAGTSRAQEGHEEGPGRPSLTATRGRGGRAARCPLGCSYPVILSILKML